MTNMGQQAPRVTPHDLIATLQSHAASLRVLRSQLIAVTGHHAQIRRVAAGSTVTATVSNIVWDTTDFASANFVATSSGVAVQVDGTYRVCGSGEYAANATGRRFLTVLKNGVEVTGYTRAQVAVNSAADGTDMILQPRDYPCVAGDVISLGMFQNSGVTLAVNNAIMTIWYLPY